MKPSNFSVCALVALALSVCGGGVAAAADPPEASACQEPASDVPGLPAFADPATKKHYTLNGIEVDVLKNTKDLQPSLDAMTNAENAYAWNALEGHVSAADLKKLAADPTQLAILIEAMAVGSADTGIGRPEVSLKPVKRSRLLSNLVSPKSRGAAKKSGRLEGLLITDKAFQKAFRPVMKSMINGGVTAAYSVEWCPDWCDEGVVVVTKSGQIRAIIGFGDQ
jgi:hypothetical protein